MLLFEERQLFREQYGPLVRNVQTGERMFSTCGVERILGPGCGVGTRAGREDLRHVVQSFGERISTSDRQLFEQLVGAEFNLQSVVVGISAIITRAGDTQITVCAANGLSNNRIGCGAWGYAGRNQVRSHSLQASNVRIAVDGLEQVLATVAYVAGFNGSFLSEFTLHAKTPGMDPVRPEVG